MEDTSSDSDFEKPCRSFWDLDQSELSNVDKGALGSEKWAECAFLEWRELMGKDTSFSIGVLSDSVDLRSFVNELKVFVLQATKKNEALYNPTSIEALDRSIGRLIRAQQNTRSIECGVAFVPFDVITDPRYRAAHFANDEFVCRSVTARIGREVRKSDALTPNKELRVLGQEKVSKHSPSSLNLQFAYFCTRNFCIRGLKELRQVNECDFELIQSHFGEVLCFKQGQSKNYKFDLLHADSNKHRKLIDCHLSEVINTIKIMLSKKPE